MEQNDLIRVSAEGSQKTVSFSAHHLNCVDSGPKIAGHLTDMISNHPQPDQGCLHLDFKDIDRITSVGLNQLIGINNQARNCGMRLVLLDVQESVRDIFSMTRLERMFEFASTSASS
jgi:anti-anti-sigma factor